MADGFQDDLLAALRGDTGLVGGAISSNRSTNRVANALPHPLSNRFGNVMDRIDPAAYEEAKRATGILDPASDGEMMMVAAAALQIQEEAPGDPFNDTRDWPAEGEDELGYWDAAHRGNRAGQSIINNRDDTLRADPVGNGPNVASGSTDAIRAKVLGDVMQQKQAAPATSVVTDDLGNMSDRQLRGYLEMLSDGHYTGSMDRASMITEINRIKSFDDEAEKDQTSNRVLQQVLGEERK